MSSVTWLVLLGSARTDDGVNAFFSELMDVSSSSLRALKISG